MAVARRWLTSEWPRLNRGIFGCLSLPQVLLLPNSCNDGVPPNTDLSWDAWSADGQPHAPCDQARRTSYASPDSAVPRLYPYVLLI